MKLHSGWENYSNMIGIIVLLVHASGLYYSERGKKYVFTLSINLWMASDSLQLILYNKYGWQSLVCFFFFPSSSSFPVYLFFQVKQWEDIVAKRMNLFFIFWVWVPPLIKYTTSWRTRKVQCIRAFCHECPCE